MIDPAKTCSLGALIVGGDWAIAHGDADGLAHVAAALRVRFGGLLSVELEELQGLCTTSYQRAAARWFVLHDDLTKTSRGTALAMHGPP